MRMNPVPLGDSKMLNDGAETIQSHSTDDSKGNSTVTGSSCVKGNTDEEKPGGSKRSRSGGAPDRRRRGPHDYGSILIRLLASILRWSFERGLHRKFESKEDCPPVYSYNGWLDVRPIYVRDMWNYDVYQDMPKYGKPVLILHGDKEPSSPCPIPNEPQRPVRMRSFTSSRAADTGSRGKPSSRQWALSMVISKKNRDTSSQRSRQRPLAS